MANDMLASSFVWLSVRDLVLRARHVCQLWQKVSHLPASWGSESKWIICKNPDGNMFSNLKSLAITRCIRNLSFRNTFPLLQSVELYMTSENKIVPDEKYFDTMRNKLLVTSFTYYESGWVSKTLYGLVREFPNLTILKLHSIQVTDVWFKKLAKSSIASQLVYLSIEDHYAIETNTVVTYVARFVNVQVFLIKTKWDRNIRYLQAMSTLKHLKQFTINLVMDLKLPTIVFPCVHRLLIEYTDVYEVLSSDYVIKVLRMAPIATEISIRTPKVLPYSTPYVLEELASRKLPIEKLQINREFYLPIYPSPLHSIQELFIDNVEDINCIKDIFRLEQLHILCLSFSSKVSEANLVTFFHQASLLWCINLFKLRIIGIDKLDSFVDFIQSKLPITTTIEYKLPDKQFKNILEQMFL